MLMGWCSICGVVRVSIIEARPLLVKCIVFQQVLF